MYNKRSRGGSPYRCFLLGQTICCIQTITFEYREYGFIEESRIQDNITGAFFQKFRVFDTEINSARRSAAQKIGAGDLCVPATCSATEIQPMECAKRGGFVKYVQEGRWNVRSLSRKE